MLSQIEHVSKDMDTEREPDSMSLMVRLHIVIQSIKVVGSWILANQVLGLCCVKHAVCSFCSDWTVVSWCKESLGQTHTQSWGFVCKSYSCIFWLTNISYVTDSTTGEFSILLRNSSHQIIHFLRLEARRLISYKLQQPNSLYLSFYSSQHAHLTLKQCFISGSTVW